MLDSKFFSQDTASVAKALVGMRLLVRRDGEVSRHQITETEGYLGEEDTASHARFGRTKRSEIMFDSPGQLNVYLVYGIHHMLNIVTEPEGAAGAVLIRGIDGAAGPGKLTAKLGIKKEEYNSKFLGKQTGAWIEERPDDFKLSSIEATPRIGIDYANKKWLEKKLRFVLSKE
ncbi:MAG: DNA-3-methyladenine glycosylase [Candidatus Paceibacterota bacterium]